VAGEKRRAIGWRIIAKASTALAAASAACEVPRRMINDASIMLRDSIVFAWRRSDAPLSAPPRSALQRSAAGAARGSGWRKIKPRWR